LAGKPILAGCRRPPRNDGRVFFSFALRLDFATPEPVISTKTRGAVSVGNFFTIGYQQSNIRRFLSLLRSREIEILIDVRAIPLSRKPGFSKYHLSATLANAGIEYRHVVNLGAPKRLRERLRSGGTWWEYIKGYNVVLQREVQCIDELVLLAATRRICLLCFERDAAECHRSLIAREMERRSNGLKLKVEHIFY
jgi:uncharacterized protein (DUF488 family)